MDIHFSDVNMREAINKAMGMIAAGQGGVVVSPAAEHALKCKKDEGLLEIINTADLVLPDGISVAYAARILGVEFKGRVPGVDFAGNLCSAIRNTGRTLYLFGAKPGVAERAAQALLAKYPGLTIAGTHDGYYDDEAVVLAEIEKAQPDVLFVCLGAPAQEYFMHRSRDKLPRCLMAGLGGSLDVFAGEVKRAPAAFQRLGLEWLYRLFTEPKRITRMIKLPLYLFEAVKWRMKGGDKDAQG